MNLPIELLARIISFLDRPTLKQLRCSCFLFSELARNALFRVLRIFPGDESRSRSRSIIETESLRKQVRIVYLNTCERDLVGAKKKKFLKKIWAMCSFSNVLPSDSFQDSDYESEGEEDVNKIYGSNQYYDKKAHYDLPLKLAPSVAWQVPCLTQLPQLQYVAVRFQLRCSTFDQPQWERFRSEYLKMFWLILRSLPMRPRSLAFQNIQNVNPEDPRVVATMQQALEGLQALRLNIVSEHLRISPENDWEVSFIPRREHMYSMAAEQLQLPKPHIFFPQLPSMWLRPTMSTLEHLTLYSDHYFGYYAKVDLASVHFPRLKTLALGGYTFFHDTQLDWIVSHGPTLRELYLDQCPMLYAIGHCDGEEWDNYHPIVQKWEKTGFREGFFLRYLYPTRWHDYFATFQTKLPHLCHFRIGKSTWKYEFPFEKEGDIVLALFPERYIVHTESGYGVVDDSAEPNGRGEVPCCDQEDEYALRALLQKIGQDVGEQELVMTEESSDKLPYWG